MTKKYLDKTGLETYEATIKSRLNNKQDKIDNLSTIESNATAGKSASDTIASYGNIVTHNISEFATSSQGAKADTALQSYTETDPVFSASAASGITSADISNWNSKTSNVGTVTSVNNVSPDSNGNVTIQADSEVEIGSTAPTDENVELWVDESEDAEGYVDQETDPVFTSSPAHNITNTDISNWNNKQDSISDLSTMRTNISNSIKQGGTLTAPLKASGGDSSTSGKIILDQSTAGQITDTSTRTLLGFASNNATSYTVGHSNYSTNIRGSELRPTYNNTQLAMLNDTIEEDELLTINSSNFKQYILEKDIGTGYFNHNTKRLHLTLNRYFRAGTKVKCTGSLSTYKYSIIMGASPELYRIDRERRINDSNWTFSTTESSSKKSGDGFPGYDYDATTGTHTLPYDGYISITLAGASGDIAFNTFNSDLSTTATDWIVNSFIITGYSPKPRFEKASDTILPVTINQNYNSINHRGWYEAPENTLVAYKESYKRGFRMVECDISFTSDGVPVLLHDDTINRTSNGSGSIDSMTFEQVRQYDFGSWKSSSYANERIPSFEEFISLCKKLGLHPYIEIKNRDSATQSRVQELVRTVNRYGMRGKVTWISFGASKLEYIKNIDPSARLAYVQETAVTSSMISTINSLKTTTNEVFLDIDYTKLNSSGVDLCVSNDIPIEVWTVDDFYYLENLPTYVSGVTSNCINISNVYPAIQGILL